MNFPRSTSKGHNPQSKTEKSAEARDVVEAFLKAGGSIRRMPTVAVSAFACANCGHAGIAGATAGRVRKCPKCKQPLP
jgi:hypothetical protein